MKVLGVGWNKTETPRSFPGKHTNGDGAFLFNNAMDCACIKHANGSTVVIARTPGDADDLIEWLTEWRDAKKGTPCT